MTPENPENPVFGAESGPVNDRIVDERAIDTEAEVPATTAQPQASPTPQHCEITCKTKRDSIDTATLWLEGFGLFVLIVYAVATIAIWCANKKAAEAAKTAADAAVLQVGITGKTLDATIQQFHLDQRAWLAINYGPIPTDENAPIAAPMEFSNTGKTPVMGAHGFIVFMFVKRTEELNFEQPGKVSFAARLLFPNEKKPIRIPLLTRKDVRSKAAPTILTRAMLDRLTAGELSTVLFGRVDYDDVFGGHHWIKFCGYGSPPVGGDRPIAEQTTQNQNTCANYNDIDKERP